MNELREPMTAAVVRVIDHETIVTMERLVHMLESGRSSAIVIGGISCTKTLRPWAARRILEQFRRALAGDPDVKVTKSPRFTYVLLPVGWDEEPK